MPDDFVSTYKIHAMAISPDAVARPKRQEDGNPFPLVRGVYRL